MKKRLSFIILFIVTIVTTMLQAQTPKSDSLCAVLQKDTANFDVLMQLALLATDVNNMESIAYARKAKTSAMRNGDTLQFVYSSRVIGQLENRLGNVDSAIWQLSFILPIAERNNCHKDVKKILNSLAASFTYKAEYASALEYHFKSLILRERDNNKQEISITLNNIGVIYVSSLNYERGLDYLTRCLRIKEEIQDSLDLDRLYLNLATCYNNLGNQTDARVYYRRAISVCEPNCTKTILTVSYSGLGQCFLFEKNYALAKDYFAMALDLSIQENDSRSYLWGLLNLAEVTFEQGDLLSLHEFLLKIESLDGKDQFPLQLQLYYDLSSKYHLAMGDYRNAFLFQKKSVMLGETINNSKLNAKTMDVQIKFSERENFQKLQVQAALLNIQNLSIQKQRIINLLLGGVAFLTLILILVLFKMNRRKAEINKILDQLVKERTFELEQNRVDLQHLYNAQSIVLGRVCRDLISSLATIQGLNNVAVMENFVNADVYLKAAEATLFKSIKTIRANATSEYSGV